MKYLKKFNQHLNYSSYLTSSSYNQIINEDKDSIVAYCLNEYEVHYNKWIDPYNGHEYIEIGGKKWATMNVGANNITDTGLYFQWGDIKGYTTNQVGSGSGKKYFGWADYKYNSDGTSPTDADIIKYNNTDGKTVLDEEDDAVTAIWGGNWRMPTKNEYVALGAAVNTEWTADYQGSGVAGLVCTDKVDSSKVLFFPACGSCYNGNVYDIDSYSYYWSSSRISNDLDGAWHLSFDNDEVYWEGNSGRYFIGSPVRGIAD